MISNECKDKKWVDAKIIGKAEYVDGKYKLNYYCCRSYGGWGDNALVYDYIKKGEVYDGLSEVNYPYCVSLFKTVPSAKIVKGYACEGKDLYVIYTDDSKEIYEKNSEQCVTRIVQKEEYKCISYDYTLVTTYSDGATSQAIIERNSARCGYVTPTPTPTTPTPTSTQVKCPKGTVYYPSWYDVILGKACDQGYTYGTTGLGTSTCACQAATEEEKKAAGITTTSDISSTLGQLFQYLPMIIIAMIVIAVLGAFRR